MSRSKKKGQSVVEYAVLVAFIACVVPLVYSYGGQTVQAAMQKMEQAVTVGGSVMPPAEPETNPEGETGG